MLKITKLRQLKGMSKAALARKARLDQTLISKIESGRLRPYDCELLRLATALDILDTEAQSLLVAVASDEEGDRHDP